jgi:hypothetical protein
MLMGMLLASCGGGDTGTTEGEAEAEAEGEAEGDCELTCDDGVACTEDSLDEEACECEFQPLHGRCPLGQICDGKKGCTSPPPCAVAEDCPDLEGACLQESCNSAPATCVYSQLDSDGDGHAPQICKSVSGDDCDDADDDVYPGAPERCRRHDNGKATDDDCDGVVDMMSEPCGTDVGLCLSGMQTCIMGGWTECAGEIEPTAELCDGEDNDCDGMTDETFPTLGAACDGTDGDLCEEGLTVCNVSGTGTLCTDTTGTTTEICNGADDDCDGIADEDWLILGASCTAGMGACQGTGVYVCATDLSGVSCTALAEGTPSPELCNDIDDDCDGAIDELWQCSCCFSTGNTSCWDILLCTGDPFWCLMDGCADAQNTYFALDACWDAARSPGGTCEDTCATGTGSECDACINDTCAVEGDACFMQAC